MKSVSHETIIWWWIESWEIPGIWKKIDFNTLEIPKEFMHKMGNQALRILKMKLDYEPVKIIGGDNNSYLICWWDGWVKIDVGYWKWNEVHLKESSYIKVPKWTQVEATKVDSKDTKFLVCEVLED